MPKLFPALALCAALALPLATPAAQRTETIAIGASPQFAFADAKTGRALVANGGAGRGAPGSLAVLERSGKLTTIALDSAPLAMAGSTALRRAVMPLASGHAAIVDLDSLQVAAVRVGMAPLHVVVAEATGKAYVLARGLAATEGSITEVDLRTRASRTLAFPGFTPSAAAVDAAGTKLYVAGPAGFLQAIDLVAFAPLDAAQRPGRMAREVVLNGAGDVVMLGQSDAARPALFVLDAQLAPKRVIELADSREIAGLQLGANGRAYLADRGNARVLVVDLASGATSATDLEAPPLALGLNAATRTLVAPMPSLGLAAVLSSGGERLDTVPLAHAPADGRLASHYAVAVDPSTGDAFVTNGHDDTITLLPKAADAGRVHNLTGLWFNPQDPGWGVFVDQQGATAFGALFLYARGGEASWLVMSNGMRQADGSFQGLLYRTRGPVSRALSNVAPVGFMRLSPLEDGAVTLTTVIDGASSVRKVSRFAFEGNAAICGWASSGSAKAALARANFTALWSNPADPGWGLALAHQKQSAFAVIFAYDEANQPTWMVMSNGKASEAGAFAGDLYRVARGKVEAMGTMALRFTSADEGAVAYRIDGLEFRSPLLRQSVSSLLSRCDS